MEKNGFYLKSYTRNNDWRLHEEVDTGSPGVVTEKGNRVWVSAELFNVLLDPLQGRDLVHQAVVGHPGLPIRADVGVEEA